MDSVERPSFNDWYITDAPKTLDDIYGQDLIVQSFRKDFKARKFPKSTLFMGEFGSGKTALAKILIKAMSCKTPNPDGSGCGTCSSCQAIENEKWNREVIYMNAENMGAQDVRDTIEKGLLTPSVRDAAKVFFIEEAQSLSAQGVEAFLIAAQSPLPNTFFVFTAMEKLKGSKAGALESRCRYWKMKVPKINEIYMYLAKYAQKRGLTQEKDIPVDFWKDGLKTLAENSENSYRKGIQLLQQCYDSKIYAVTDIKTFFDFDAEENVFQFMTELSNGQITDNTRQIMIGNEYQDKFNLMLDMLGNAKIFKIFGKSIYDDPTDWRNAQSAALAKGPYFETLCDTFLNLSKATYLKKGDFKLLIGQVVEKIQNKAATTQHLQENQEIPARVVSRRKLV
jgi:DNA polymerase III gamma/tau subunit